MEGNLTVLGTITAGGFSVQAVIVFRPGMASAGNHYETAAEVATALTAAGGAAVVYCDNSLADCVIPHGVVWDFNLLGTLVGPNNGTPLYIRNGAQLRNLCFFNGAYVQCDGVSVPTLDYDTYTSAPLLSLYYSSLTLLASSTGALLVIPDNGTVEILLYAGSVITPSNVATSAAIVIGSGAELQVISSNSTPIYGYLGNLISGPSDAYVSWTGDSTAFPIPTLSLFSGSIVPTYLSSAMGETYKPTTAADWATQPTTTQEALDRIAAVVGSSTPIP